MNLQEALSGALQKTEGGFRQLGKTDTKEMARAMLADKAERDNKTTLTWNRDNAPLVPNDRMKGEVNFNLPYHKVLNKYVIQNGKIYLMNGVTQVTLADVDKANPIEGAVLRESYEAFMKKAMEKDSRLCKDCIASSRIYSLPNDSDAVLAHMVNEHPEKVMALSRPTEPEVEPVKVAIPGPAESFVARCGKPLNTAHGKKLHELRCLSCKRA